MILEVDAMKLIEEKIGFKVNRITQLGNGYDSTSFLVNDGYLFKIKHSANEKKGYKKENAIYEFLRYNLKSDIKVPLVEYSYISEDVSIMGYKYIEGKILSPEVYKTLSDDQKEQLKQDIAKFLKQLHNLDYSEIKQYVIDNKQNVLEEYQLLKDTIYDQLSDKEKEYVEAFMKRLNTTTVFDDKKCLCHNDFSCNHLLLDENNRLCGIIDFGDSGIIDEYADFVYLLEDSDEELGHEFGEDILKLYGNIDIEKTTEYQKLVDDYYPIETIIYGIKNNQKEFIEKGRRLIKARK